MPDLQRGSYFVALGDRPRPSRPAAEAFDEPSFRRRRRRVRALPVVAIVVAGLLVWGQTTDGGASARINDVIDKARELLFKATSDPDLRRGTEYFNDEYARTGSYPVLSESEETASVGIGVEVVHCDANAIVLQGLTSSGTVSRLLLAGNDLGDQRGRVGCPASLVDPQPWHLDGSG